MVSLEVPEKRGFDLATPRLVVQCIICYTIPLLGVYVCMYVCVYVCMYVVCMYVLDLCHTTSHTYWRRCLSRLRPTDMN